MPVQGERASRRAVRALLLRVASVKPLDDLQEPQVSGDVMVENLSLTHTTYTHTHTHVLPQLRSHCLAYAFYGPPSNIMKLT